MKFELIDEFITLTNLLKVCNLAYSGGHAKLLIQSGNVKLDGLICTQRGKKIIAGNIVKCNIDGEITQIDVIRGSLENQ